MFGKRKTKERNGGACSIHCGWYYRIWNLRTKEKTQVGKKYFLHAPLLKQFLKCGSNFISHTRVGLNKKWYWCQLCTLTWISLLCLCLCLCMENYHGKYHNTNVSHLELMWMKSFSLECLTTSQYLVLDVSMRPPFRQYIFNSWSLLGQLNQEQHVWYRHIFIL